MEITSSIDIDRPASEVFRYLADMENNPRWQNGQESCVWTSDPPLGLGSTYDQRARFLGKAIISSFEVVEFEADKTIRIKSTSGTMPIDVTRTVTERGSDGCSVSAIVRGDPPLPMRLLGPLMKWMVSRNVSGDYVRLKALLEGGA